MKRNACFPAIARATVIEGAVGTGKTTELMRRIAAILAAGSAAKDIMVFCASPSAAADFKARLVKTYSQAKDVVVTTPREGLLKFLNTEEAENITGRDAHILAPFEYDFFLEDLKTSGIEIKRLHQIMAFFNKQYAELDDFEDGWLMTVEEQELYDLMQNCLGFTRGIMPNEEAGLFVRVCKELGKNAPHVPHVFVDDFTLMSRGSQVALSMLASESIAIAANALLTCEVYEEYPNAEGIEEFLQENPDAERVHLTTSHICPASFDAAKAMVIAAKTHIKDADEINKDELAAEEAAKNGTVFVPLVGDEEAKHLLDGTSCDGAGDGEIVRMHTRYPKEEIKAVCAEIAAALETGMAPEDIVVVAPVKKWQSNMVLELRSAGIAVQTLTGAKSLSGDIRDFARCDAAQVFTALQLVADRYNGVALRSWCGFGDYLTNSNGVATLREFGKNHGKALDAVLQDLSCFSSESLAEDRADSFQRIQSALGRLEELLSACRGLEGKKLLEVITAHVLGENSTVPDVISAFVAPFAGLEEKTCFDDSVDKTGMSAAAMVARALYRIQFPCVAGEGVVRVLPYENVCGVSPKRLFIIAFVNGFMPKHDYFDADKLTFVKRRARRVEDFTRASLVFGRATQSLCVSHFELIDILSAERSHMIMDRIALKGVERMAYSQPSSLLDVL